ncbi:LysR family transcriptional regulator ArgP [Streptomyces sp. NPDC048172]|uniref:LysR family transcriptional regulator ArgP n=1 Tax=Streptomyces sp. NPDC048172 TaxID=3365505 RepID=UPI003716BFAD
MSVSELPLDQVRTLLAVVDEGTFDAAAAALHVTPPAVSQRVKALERRTGRVLLTRTKPVRPTESGQAVVRFARQVAQLERDTRASLGMSEEDEPFLLPVAVNADSLATWFLPALSRVPEDEGICFELHREDEFHTLELLREGVVMAAVTSSSVAVAGCTVRRLGTMRYLPVAAPRFAERHLGTWPEVPLREVLPDAPAMFFDRRETFQDDFVRRLTDGRRAASARRHYVPTSDGFVDAITAGLGWGMVPEEQAEPRLRAGSLIRLDPDRDSRVPLFWQQWRLDSPALAVTAEAVLSAASQSLGP